MTTADQAIARALSYAETLRSHTELEVSTSGPEDIAGYSAVTIAMSNIAIAQAIIELADAVVLPRD